MKSLLFRSRSKSIADDLILPPQVKAIHSARARRMTLRLDHAKGYIKLVIPKGTPLYYAQDFVDKHGTWIAERLCELPAGIPYAHGTKIPVLGTLRQINIAHDATLKRTSITLNKKTINIKTNKSDPTPRLERFFKTLAKDTLLEMSREKSQIIDKEVNSVSVRDTKTRWGSCTSNNDLSYSWRLIFAPFEAMDYVVAHEVAHLQHLDHSKAFWALCQQLSDDYVEGKYWMQNHGHELMRYGRAAEI